jgi:hypothetical protein
MRAGRDHVPNVGERPFAAAAQAERNASASLLRRQHGVGIGPDRLERPAPQHFDR